MENVLRAIRQIILDAQTAAAPADVIKNVKRIFIWNPVLIPASSLPALAVYLPAENVTWRGTEYDQDDGTIKIKYVQNLKNFLGVDDSDEQLLEIDAMRLFAERDVLEKIRDVSIIGALRRNSSFNNTVQWNGNYAVAYEYLNMENWVAFESTLTIQVKKISART